MYDIHFYESPESFANDAPVMTCSDLSEENALSVARKAPGLSGEIHALAIVRRFSPNRGAIVFRWARPQGSLLDSNKNAFNPAARDELIRRRRLSGASFSVIAEELGVAEAALLSDYACSLEAENHHIVCREQSLRASFGALLGGLATNPDASVGETLDTLHWTLDEHAQGAWPARVPRDDPQQYIDPRTGERAAVLTPF
jgi:hypothetical protein